MKKNTKLTKELVVLSLFDGMSCGRLALTAAGFKIGTYIASEIKKFAISNTQKRYPDTIQVGDVRKLYYNKWNHTLYANCERKIIDSLSNHKGRMGWTPYQKRAFEMKHLEICDDGNIYKWEWHKATPIFTGEIDLILSGSPCQNFSSAHYFSHGAYGLEGDKSVLFYEFLRLLKEVNPKYYFFENVRMRKDSEKQLNDYLNTNALHINSNLLTYQNRDRLYWTNITGITIPKDKQLNFQDYKLKTLPRIETLIRHNKFNEDKKPLNLTKKEIDLITNQNLWAYEELKKSNTKMSKRAFVDELHRQLEEATPKVVDFRIKMWDACLTKGKYASKNLDLASSTKIGALTTKNDRGPSSGGLIAFGDFYRYLTRLEMSKAQDVPFDYVKDLSYNQTTSCCGDGWTISIIAHCLSFMK